MPDKLRAIYRSTIHEDFVQRLARSPHPIKKTSIFPTIKDLLCFAAVLGFSEGKKIPLSEKYKKEDIQKQIFIDDGKVNIIFLIALADQKDSNVLRDDNPVDIVKIFEEYANGGLEIMKAWEIDTPDDTRGDKALVHGLIKKEYLKINEEADTNEKPIEF